MNDKGNRAAGVLAALVFALAFPIMAVSQEYIVTTQDALLKQDQSTQNNGAVDVLDVRAQKAASNLKNSRALAGFDFTGGDFLGCTVESATFQMFLEAQQGLRTYEVYQVSGAWAEGSVTWAQQTTIPLSQTGAASSHTVSSGDVGGAVSWFGFATAVQSAIDNQTQLSLRVWDSSEAISSNSNMNNFAQFTSREGAVVPGTFAPRLVLELDCDDDCTNWDGETAWAAGTRYINPGNWATYTPYAADNTVTLYAGQHHAAGTAQFSSAVGGYVTVTITLNAGFRFADVPENVKIENYLSAPSGNPSPGGFSDKDYAEPTSSMFEIAVPENVYYGVHVDVERCADTD